MAVQGLSVQVAGGIQKVSQSSSAPLGWATAVVVAGRAGNPPLRELGADGGGGTALFAVRAAAGLALLGDTAGAGPLPWLA